MIFRYKIKFISDIEQKIRKLLVNIAVAPFVGVWIEMSCQSDLLAYNQVAPFVGVWIEIDQKSGHVGSWWSLPLWECGLKYHIDQVIIGCKCVAPFVGVWIEIYLKIQIDYNLKSLPLWECGLK